MEYMVGRNKKYNEVYFNIKNSNKQFKIDKNNTNKI